LGYGSCTGPWFGVASATWHGHLVGDMRGGQWLAARIEQWRSHLEAGEFGLGNAPADGPGWAARGGNVHGLLVERIGNKRRQGWARFEKTTQKGCWELNSLFSNSFIDCNLN
jgi:hypothetical protein